MKRVIEEVCNSTCEDSFFRVLKDDLVISGCCACDGLTLFVVCVHGFMVFRWMRDPRFSVQCGSFTQRFLQVWRHLRNLLT